ncbi:spermidine synthase [Kiloniella sp. EL199]|uniref:spermidine synthase n=1 Tax=Kiloniella sp. EL199 TaxID=2107581 RepID=UPI000EA22302|nr:fused MFS/spermidine synthase [Kiloniella sp. EL199]
MNSNTKTTNTKSDTLVRYLFILTLCSSAFLLFLIQPMFTKLVLPLLGGAPAVWNTAMIFFQSILLAGYLYAHFLSSAFTLKKQIVIHLVLMAAAILFLPIAIPTGYEAPSESWPTIWLLGLFTIAIGLPFFIISANAPLLQDWFRSSQDKDAHDPYFLYAASNIGSIAALAAYPLFIEIQFGLKTQTFLWSYGFLFLLFLIFLCGILLRNKMPDNSSLAKNNEDNVAEHAPDLKAYLNWILLAFVPSALLLSTTNKITTDLLATPLLWVIPLGLYLLTFVIVFSQRPIIPHKFIAIIAPYCLIATAVFNMSTTHAGTIIPYVIGSLISFFVLALYCHGRLALARPPATHLTNFYIAMSFGGVLGGIFVGIIAPVIFSNIYEYVLLLMLVALLMPIKTQTIIAIINRRVGQKAYSYFADIIFSIILLGLILLIQQIQSDDLIFKLLKIIPLTLILLLLVEGTGRPLRLALSIGISLLVVPLISGSSGQLIFQERSFFGVYTVRKANNNDQTVHIATHGTTIHGIQNKGSLEPLSYYHHDTGLGQLLKADQRQNKAIKTVAAIGLGAGTAICYSRPEQNWVFFEIDPLVEVMARDPELFTYMNECGKETDVIIGDARLSLKKIQNQSYDLLIADAFSSDSIPAHLLTKEAFDIYKNKIKDNGIIILHISNRYFDLEPIIAVTSNASGLHSRIYSYTKNEKENEKHPNRFASTWVALAKAPHHLDRHIPLSKNPSDEKHNVWRELVYQKTDQPWTDDYSNVLSAFR